MTNFEATLLSITKRSKISPYEQMHKEAVRAKRARVTKWNASDIESELRDAQITDKWTGLTSKTAIDFVKIGAARGMNINITLGADDLFVAEFTGRQQNEGKTFIVMCQVSGGVTGTRVAPLKSNGEIRYFDTHAAALQEAERLNRTMNHQHSTASFRYWVEEGGN